MAHTSKLSSHEETTGSLTEQIDHWLPQTQCTRCGYPRCREYAEAVAKGGADINQCPPGGEVTIQALAKLLDVAAVNNPIILVILARSG